MRLIRLVVLVVLVTAMQGCATASYYSQIISGHMRIVLGKRPVSDVLADDTLQVETRRRLELAQRARSFAVSELALPDNKSYTTYYDINREYVTWNVVAAGEFSFVPTKWCFPVAGCVSYRGYYAEENAREYAQKLAAQGLDVAVNGATAYSTLGWFADPLLSTMLNRSDPFIASLLFHELAHQQIYVSDDSKFNESFAVFVEQAGLLRWQRRNQNEDQSTALEQRRRRQADFIQLLAKTRDALEVLYQSDIDEKVMRAGKAVHYAELLGDYEKLKASWGGYQGYDAWFKRELNNARLVAIATYNDYVPAFKVLFEDSGENFPMFYKAVSELALLPGEQRTESMEQLSARAEQLVSAGNQ